MRLTAFIWLVMLCNTVYGHGDLDKRIKEISIKILQDPTNTDLFLNRGELYFQHEDYELSVKDFKVCEERDLISDRLNLNFSRSYRELQNYTDAEKYVNKILVKNPIHVLALKVKANIAFDQEEFEYSADLFRQVIEHVDKPHVDNYFEACQALENCGTKECMQEAIALVEEGVEDLGELMVLLDRGVSISLRLKDFAKAHVFQNKIIENASRKERTYYKKAMLFLEQGDNIKAKKNFQNAYTAFNNLPERIKKNKASKKFESELINQLNATH